MDPMSKNMEKEIKVILFRLGDEEYGLEVHSVRSIERMQPVTRMPQMPPFVKGVIHLRGEITPVVDLKSRLGLKETPASEQSRMIIVYVGQMQVGLIVDAATDVIDIPVHSIEPAPAIFGETYAAYLHGVAKLPDRLLLLLNLDRLFSREEVIQLQVMESSV
jgi:purine-binding chemotaxis protein CheW